MYLSKDASGASLREAQNARNNRAEIVKALSRGQVTRRELIKWGIFTTAGTLALTNGLSPYAHSQVLPSIPTGTPRSPLYGVAPFTQPLPRLRPYSALSESPTISTTASFFAWAQTAGLDPNNRLAASRALK